MKDYFRVLISIVVLTLGGISHVQYRQNKSVKEFAESQVALNRHIVSTLIEHEQDILQCADRDLLFAKDLRTQDSVIRIFYNDYYGSEY